MIKWFYNVYMVVATVIKSLWVTLVIGSRTYDQQRKTFTERYEYPELPVPVAPRFRGFHRYKQQGCFGCGICVRDCPVNCIYMVKEKQEGRKGFWVTAMVIDYSKCMFCGLCTQGCGSSCLAMGQSHDLSCYTRDGCVVDFCKLPEEIAWGETSLNPALVARTKTVTVPETEH